MTVSYRLSTIETPGEIQPLLAAQSAQSNEHSVRLVIQGPEFTASLCGRAQTAPQTRVFERSAAPGVELHEFDAIRRSRKVLGHLPSDASLPVPGGPNNTTWRFRSSARSICRSRFWWRHVAATSASQLISVSSSSSSGSTWPIRALLLPPVGLLPWSARRRAGTTSATQRRCG